MVTKEQLQSAKKLIPRARRALRKYNFIRAKKLSPLLQINTQRASDVLGALPEWNIYSGGKSNLWAREGHPQ